MPNPNEQDPLFQAQKKALRLLGIRSRSCKEMRDRLLAYGYQEQTAEEVLEKLIHLGLLDDRRFACERARAMGKGKGWGPRKLRWDLVRCGVPADLVDQAVDQAYGKQSCKTLMRQLVKKRYGEKVLSPESNAKIRGKALRYLLGRGFEPEEVHALFPPL